MGTSLNGLSIKDTYNGLLKTTDNSSLTAGFKVVSDGVGNDSGLQLSTAGIKITGTLDAASASSILGFNTFRTIVAGGTNLVAANNADTLTIQGGTGIQVSGNGTSETIVINYTGDSTFVNTINGLINDVNVLGGSGIEVLTAGQNITATLTADTKGFGQLQTLPQNITLSAGTANSLLKIREGSGIQVSGNSSTNEVLLTYTGASGGVTSLEGLTGALTFSGNNITIGTSGSNTITLSAATNGGGGGGGAVTTYTNTTQFNVLTADGPGAIKSYSAFTFNDSNVFLDRDLVLNNQRKLVLDNDATNTYIQAGTDDPESIILNADRSIQLFTDENIDFYGGLTSPFHIAQMTFTGASTPLMAVGGAVVTSGATLHTRGTFLADRNLLKTDYTASGGTQGDIIRIGTTTTVAGNMYVLSGSTWVLADRTNCDRLIAIAVGTNSGTDGMLVRGTTSHRGGTFTIGDPLYVSTANTIDTLGVVTYGQIVRRVGVALGGIQILFDPEPYNRPETFYQGGGVETILTAWRREFGSTGGVNGTRVGTLGQDIVTTRQTGLTVNTSTISVSAFNVQYFGIRNPAKGRVFANFDLRVTSAAAYNHQLLWKIWSTPGSYTNDTTSNLTLTLRGQTNMTTHPTSTVGMSRFNIITTSDIPENDIVFVTWGDNQATDFSANTGMNYNYNLGVIPT